MPAKPVTIVKQTKPTTESAIAGFQQLFENMKSQSASWMNYINIQGQSGNFDVLRMLKSAFFMQAMNNRQLFLEFSDRTKVTLKDFQVELEKNSAVLVYAVQEEDYFTQQLFVLGDKTAIFLKKHPSYEWSDIYVLTFDRSLLEAKGAIHQMLYEVKGKNVQMETS